MGLFSSKEAESTINRICRGDFSNLPNKPSKTVKIFLSSTTKDYRVERDFIIETLYTELRKHFKKQYDFDLTLIDLRWGIRRDNRLSNITTQFCINEIRKCLQESIGPAFITFLSHRYGTVSFREAIPENEFETIAANSSKVDHNGVDLLRYCYEIDENDIGEKKFYKLKSKKELFDGLLGLEDVWEGKERELLRNIRDAAKRIMSAEDGKKYSWSITEEEIVHGILKNENANQTSLAFFRNIIHSQNDVATMDKEGYLDKEPEFQTLQTKLKENVEKKLRSGNRIYLEVNWRHTNFRDRQNEYTKEYLDRLRTALTTSIGGLIQSRTEAMNQLSDDDIEVIHHASFCNRILECFIERDEYTQKLLKYTANHANTRPFIVYGPSGTGKSSLMADAIRKLKNKDTLLAIRFMGTSRQSSNIFSVFKSLIYQFSRFFYFDVAAIKEPEDVTEAMKILFNEVLKNKITKGKKIIIVLDSIDQLTEKDYSLSWMITQLPKHVKIVYTTVSEHGGILETIKGHMDFVEYSDTNYTEITSITAASAVKQFKKKLNNESRDLQNNQLELVKSCLRKSSQIYPLHVKLLSDISSKWKSTYIPSSAEERIDGCTSIKATIGYLFRRFELHFGSVLFSHFVFYLTIFKNGVSESELEDVLSIDDEVLNEVFDKHEPPIRRFPPSILVRLLDALKDYVTRKQSDDTLVYSWFHRSFFEASREIYKHLFEPSDKRDKMLQNVIDYFREEWREKPKEYQWMEKDQTIIKSSIRYTQSQQIRYKTMKGGIESAVYNKRKLTEYVDIILLLDDKKKKIEYLMNDVYLNYEFMHSQAQLRNFHFVLDTHTIIENFSKAICDPELKQKLNQLADITSIYVSQLGTLNQFPDNLLYEVISRVEDDLAYRMMKSIGNNFALIPLQNLFNSQSNPHEQVVYTKDSRTSHFKIFWVHSSPYLFVECELYKDDDRFRVKLINYKSAKDIEGEISYDKDFSFPPCIFLNKKPEEKISRISDLDGGIIYYNDKDKGINSIILKTFQNSSFVMASCKEWPEICFLSNKSILVKYSTSFEIINFSNYKKPNICFKSETFGENIVSIEATALPSRGTDVMVPEFGTIENTIVCVCFRKSVVIFNYDKTQNIIVGEKELIRIDVGFDIARWEKGCIIDRYFKSQSILADNRVHSMKNSNKVISILLNEMVDGRMRYSSFNQENTQMKGRYETDNQIFLLNVFKSDTNDVKYELVNLKKPILEALEAFNSNNKYVKIFDFVSNLIVFSAGKVMHKVDYFGYMNFWFEYVYVYDAEQKRILNRFQLEEYKVSDDLRNASVDSKYLIIKNRFCVYVHDLYTLMTRKYDDLKDCRIKDDHLIYQSESKIIKSLIFDNKKTEINKSVSILSHDEAIPTTNISDTLEETNNQRNRQLLQIGHIANIIDFIGKNYLLMHNDTEEMQGVFLANIEKGQILACDIDAKSRIDVNNTFHILSSKYNEEEKCFKINKYELDEENGEIKRIKEYTISTPDIKLRIYTLDVWNGYRQEKVEKTENVRYCITHSNNYLVYLSFLTDIMSYYVYFLTDKNYREYELKYVDIETGKIIYNDRVSLLRKLSEEVNIVKVNYEDDFLIVSEYSDPQVYRKTNLKNELFRKDVNALKGELSNLLKNGYYNWGGYRRCIYDLNKMNKIYNLIYECISVIANSKYVICLSRTEVLKVYKWTNLDKETFTLNVEIDSNQGIQVNEKYLALKTKDNRVLTFLINHSI